MNRWNRIGQRCGLLCCVVLAVAVVGCKSSSTPSSSSTSPHSSASTTKPAAQPQVADTRPTIRIDAGAEAPLTDTQGVKWSADSGFDGGDIVDRPDLVVTGTN